MFELKNSHLPMYVLHDIFLENNGLKAQIDYIVITRKIVLIIECKNLYGNISVDRQGNFTRTISLGKYFSKEGIYSPITQNQRHLDLIKEKRRNTKNKLLQIFFDRYCDDTYKSVVVLANPKSTIDLRFAPKDISKKIVKADNLINYIKNLNNESKNENMSDKDMKNLAEYFLSVNVPNTTDYTAKYNIPVQNNEPTDTNKPQTIDPAEKESSMANLRSLLMDYRNKQRLLEDVPAYFIFSNSQLEDLLTHTPQTIEELKSIKGFGEVKCNKYGNDILDIIKQYKF
jgi:superfamily II DNA helicase RecQ